MLKDITLGQFFPGESYIHRLDPRTKIILTVFYIIITFSAKSIFSFAALFLSVVMIIGISKISFKTIIRGIRPVLYIMIFTMILNIFLTNGEDLLFHWKFIKIYKEGIITALLVLVRIIVLITGTSVFITYTTSPIQLTDGIERLFSPLKRIGVPVHDLAMMMSLALRFIPTLIEETDRIMNAQKARGADFSTGSLASRVRALIPIIIPLFVSAYRRAEELAVAMECRCYRGGEGRTRMKILTYGLNDFFAIFIFLLFLAAIILINIYAPGFKL
ncbi:MAG: energy-coupling factor transporter transmembrane protein EcfT [Clostridiales bacterium]|nr:energy-coupling factor transporter transmembrane protein EcfT [Clostridiales bacterium]